jgi:rSAM/selenodomain-associated transferase 2
LASPRIAVVIPTLDEEKALRRSLQPLSACADEIVVSDGGSTDRTAAIATQLGARVVSSPPGRGIQLNTGAAACNADAFLFLHADTVLPGGQALDNVRTALRRGHVGGGFQIRFDSPRAVFRFGSAMVNIRTRVTRAPLGDQAQFVSREAFETIGGYQDWPILEDLDFIRRLRRHGKLAILTPVLSTSARRFERYGPVRTLVNNWLIFTLFSLGVSPQKLHQLYPNNLR